MQITKRKAGILLILLWPIVSLIRLYKWLTVKDLQTAPLTNVEAPDPVDFSLKQPVVLSLWADWASVWKVATEPIVRGLESRFGNTYSFIYLDGTKEPARSRFREKVLPVVLVFREGKEVGRFVNLSQEDELRSLLEQTHP